MSTQGQQLAIPAVVHAPRAWAVVGSKLPGAVQVSVEERFHPFAAVLFDVSFGASGWFRPRKVPVLVDSYGGRAYLTAVWPQMKPSSQERATLMDLGKQKIADEEARRAARTLASTAVMREVKVGRLFDLSETEFVPTVWKPNWLVTARWKDHEIRVLVDALDGSYYVISSFAVDARP